MLAARCNPCAKCAHNILFSHDINQATIILHRNKIASASVRPSLQFIRNLTKISTKCVQHRFSVPFTLRTTHSLFPWKIRDRSCNRLCHLRINRSSLFHTVNGFSQRYNISFHLLIQSGIFARQFTVLTCMCIQKRLSFFPKRCPLLAHS